MDIPLVPIYRSLKSKPEPDIHVMEKIYDKAYSAMTCLNDKHLIILINILKKEKNISADMMGKFAIKYDSYTSILFGLLKRYFIDSKNTVSTNILTISTNEDNKLTQALGIQNTIFNFIVCPSYTALKNNIRKLNHIHKQEADLLSQSIYNGASVLFEGYPSYFNLMNKKYELYNTAYKLLIQNGCTQDIFNLVQIIAAEKVLNITEKDIGYSVLTYIPQTLKEKLVYLCDINYTSLKTKNRIALFLHLVEQYNNQRGDKLTPTGKQLYSYGYQKDLNLALPDSFNTLLFDNHYYAFEEFDQLRNNVITLMQSDDENVKNCVDQIYK